MKRPKPAVPAINNSMDKFVEGVRTASPPVTVMGKGTVSVLANTRNRPAIIRTPKSASGWRQPTAFSGLYETWTPYLSGIGYTYYQGRPGDWWESHSNSFGTPSGKISLTSVPGSMSDRAVVKALAKLKNQKVNLSVAFGERRDAAKMMSNTVINIAKSIRKFKGANPKEWVKVLSKQTGHGQWRNIPNSWLELQYGWKPAMSDVHGAISALNAKERDGDAYRATVKAVVKEKFARTHVLSTSDWCNVPVDLKGEYGVLVRLDYTLENPFLATLAQLGITNPAELVWELVPYSFVVDWFTPVGAYLSSLDASLGWSLKGGSNTTFARQQGEGYALPIPDGYYKGQGNGRKYYCDQFGYNRTIYSSSPLPRFPGIKNPLSTGHVANALSLLVSAFR